MKLVLMSLMRTISNIFLVAQLPIMYSLSPSGQNDCIKQPITTNNTLSQPTLPRCGFLTSFSTPGFFYLQASTSEKTKGKKRANVVEKTIQDERAIVTEKTKP